MQELRLRVLALRAFIFVCYATSWLKHPLLLSCAGAAAACAGAACIQPGDAADRGAREEQGAAGHTDTVRCAAFETAHLGVLMFSKICRNMAAALRMCACVAGRRQQQNAASSVRSSWGGVWVSQTDRPAGQVLQLPAPTSDMHPPGIALLVGPCFADNQRGARQHVVAVA